MHFLIKPPAHCQRNLSHSSFPVLLSNCFTKQFVKSSMSSMSCASASSSPFGSFLSQTLGLPFLVCEGLDSLNSPPEYNSKCWIKLLMFSTVPLRWQDREAFSDAKNKVKAELQGYSEHSACFLPRGTYQILVMLNFY